MTRFWLVMVLVILLCAPPAGSTNLFLTIISSRANGGPSDVVRLLQSLREAGGNSDACILFVPIPHQMAEGEIWRRPNAALDEIVQLFNSEPRGKVWFHVLEFCDVCNATIPLQQSHINWAKYEGWRGAVEVMTMNWHYNRVLLVEGDSYIQTDPFTIGDGEEDPVPEVYFSFSPYTYIHTDAWGMKWMNEYNGTCCTNKLAGQRRGFINAGVLYGTRHGLMAVLQATLEHWTDHWFAPRCCLLPWRGSRLLPALRPGCTASTDCRIVAGQDQIALNYAVHFGLVRARIKEYIFPFTVPLCSIGTFAAPRDAIGRVLIDAGGPPCRVVHMYNRYMVRGAGGVLAPFQTVIESRYKYIPKEERLLLPGNGTHRSGTYLWVINHLCDREQVPQWSCQQSHTQGRCGLDAGTDVGFECKILPGMKEHLRIRRSL